MLLQQGYGLDAQATEEHVDVLSDGFAFRLRLATERDAAMAAKALAARQATEGPAARLTPADDMALRLWHQGAVGGVAAAAPAFGPTVRLAKRWVGAHLLSPHLCEEAVELLVVAVFAGEGVAARATTMLSEGGASQRDAAAAAAAAPASRLSGFLRFLRLLADHPWRVQPLLVDPQAELSQAQRDALVRAHAAAREAGAAPAMALCTPSDASGGAWTQGRPAAQLLHRLAVLAARSAARLERLLLPAAAAAGGSSEAAAAAAVAAVFSRDEREYDAIIRLRRDALPHADRDLQLPGARPKGTGKRNAGAVEPEDGGCSLSLAALAEQLSAEAEAAATKHSRAVLKGIPHSEHGAALLVPPPACSCVSICWSSLATTARPAHLSQASSTRAARAPCAVSCSSASTRCRCTCHSWRRACPTWQSSALTMWAARWWASSGGPRRARWPRSWPAARRQQRLQTRLARPARRSARGGGPAWPTAAAVAQQQQQQAVGGRCWRCWQTWCI